MTEKYQNRFGIIAKNIYPTKEDKMTRKDAEKVASHMRTGVICVVEISGKDVVGVNAERHALRKACERAGLPMPKTLTLADGTHFAY